MPGARLTDTPASGPVSGNGASHARLSWQPWLSVLLPFAAIGLLPWWVCLALCAALALSRLSDELNSIGALLTLLAAQVGPAPLTRQGVPSCVPHELPAGSRSLNCWW